MGSGKHHMGAYWDAYRQGKIDAHFDGVFNCESPDYVKKQAVFYGYGRAETLGYKAGIRAVRVEYTKLSEEAAERDS